MPHVAAVGLVVATCLLWLPALPALAPTIFWTGAAAAAGLRRFGPAALLLPLIAFRVLDAGRTQSADLLGADLVQKDLQITGTVCEFAKPGIGYSRFVLQTDATTRADAINLARLPARVLLGWYGAESVPAPGERWTMVVRLKPPHGSRNPGGFDFERWLFANRIGATGWVRSGHRDSVESLPQACPMAGLRRNLAARIATAVGADPALPYVLGLSVGAYQLLPEDEWDALRQTGTIHLVSVSGFHVALVAVPGGLIGWGLGLLLARTRVGLPPRVMAAWTALLAGAGYGLIAGFSVPTARSVLFLAVLAALSTRRRLNSVGAVLAPTVVLILLIEPLSPLLPGSWLSFGGVAALALAFHPASATDRTDGVITARYRLRTAAIGLCGAQAAVTVALAPLTAAFFGQVSMIGVLANLLAVPLFSLAVLPLVVGGSLLLTLNESLGALALALSCAILDRWSAFLHLAAGVPWAVVYLPEVSVAASIGAIVGGLWLLGPRPWPLRPAGVALLALLLSPTAAPLRPAEFRVTVFDVGQGLSVLVQTAQHALVYDAGPDYRSSDAGERIVVPALRALGLRHVDVLMVSHADADHAGGVDSVITAFPRARLIGAPIAGRSAAAPCRRGDTWEWDRVRFAVIHPDGDAWDTDNNRSCVLRVESPQGRALLTGDIEAPVERALVSQRLIPRVDLLVAPHHGSRSSSTPELVAAAAPRFVVFSAGFLNRWGFPKPDVLDRWCATGARDLNTASLGALTFEARGERPLALIAAARRDQPRLWSARFPPVDRQSRCR